MGIKYFEYDFHIKFPQLEELGIWKLKLSLIVFSPFLVLCKTPQKYAAGNSTSTRIRGSFSRNKHITQLRNPTQMGDGGRGGGGGNSGNRPEWLQHYDLLGKIGEGTYGLVFLAKIKSNGNKPIAIKKFKQSKDGDGVSPTAIREIMVPLPLLSSYCC